MVITRVSPVTGKSNEMDLPITEEQLAEWRAGKLAQDAFPNLTPEQREFLISGCTSDDWEKLFSDV